VSDYGRFVREGNIAAEAFRAGEIAGREQARKAIEGERLEETDLPLSETGLSVTGRAADRAYNRALDDALAALAVLGNETRRRNE
jgi:hypothetical protein